jgi:uncharacterized protein (DUF1697 family)
MRRSIALLRAVNVGGRKMPMAELREICAELGWTEVETYIQSGNVVFSASEPAADLEIALEHALESRFGFRSEVLVRSAAQWTEYCAGNPFNDESKRAPNLVMMTLGKRAATDADVEALRRRATGEERVERSGDAIWIWFANGWARSRIGTGPAPKEVWTTRNWRTVQAIADLLA